MFRHIINFATAVKEICGIHMLWILIHYAASHLYSRFCVPPTFWGLLMSPFLAPAPHCQALRWAIYNGGVVINSMWGVVGVWICTKLIVK